VKNPEREIRIPERDAYDWRNGLGDYTPKLYPDHLLDPSLCGKYMKVIRQYTDTNDNTRIFVVEWCVMPARSKGAAIRFAKKIPIMSQMYDTYWGLRKKHRNDEDGIPVIGWR